MRSSELLTSADYGILDFRLIISPSTTNLPYPRWWMVFGSFCAGSVQALSTSRTKSWYLVTRRGIGYLTFEIGEALCHERRHHALGWHRSQAELLELLHVPA